MNRPSAFRRCLHPPSPVGLAFPECPAPQALPVRQLLPSVGSPSPLSSPSPPSAPAPSAPSTASAAPSTPQQQLTEFQKAMTEAATRAAQTPIAPTQPAASLGSAPIAQPAAAPPVLDAPAAPAPTQATVGLRSDRRRRSTVAPISQHRSSCAGTIDAIGSPTDTATRGTRRACRPRRASRPPGCRSGYGRCGSPCTSAGFGSTCPPRGGCRSRDSRSSAPSLDRQ